MAGVWSSGWGVCRGDAGTRETKHEAGVAQIQWAGGPPSACLAQSPEPGPHSQGLRDFSGSLPALIVSALFSSPALLRFHPLQISPLQNLPHPVRTGSSSGEWPGPLGWVSAGKEPHWELDRWTLSWELMVTGKKSQLRQVADQEGSTRVGVIKRTGKNTYRRAT